MGEGGGCAAPQTICIQLRNSRRIVFYVNTESIICIVFNPLSEEIF